MTNIDFTRRHFHRSALVVTVATLSLPTISALSACAPGSPIATDEDTVIDELVTRKRDIIKHMATLAPSQLHDNMRKNHEQHINDLLAMRSFAEPSPNPSQSHIPSSLALTGQEHMIAKVCIDAMPKLNNKDLIRLVVLIGACSREHELASDHG